MNEWTRVNGCDIRVKQTQYGPAAEVCSAGMRTTLSAATSDDEAYQQACDLANRLEPRYRGCSSVIGYRDSVIQARRVR